MLDKISDTIGSMPFSILCLAAGAFAGRTFCLAGACKISAKIADLVGDLEAAEEWDQASNHHWKQAEKTAYRDLTAVTGLFALGIISKYALETHAPNEEAKEDIDLPKIDLIARLKNIPIWLISTAIIWNTRAQSLRFCQNLLQLKRGWVQTELEIFKQANDIYTNLNSTNHSLLFQIQETTKELNWWKDRILCLQNIQEAVL